MIVIHELPGMTPDVIGFAEEVVARGHTVVMPHLFGEPEAPPGVAAFAKTIPRVCVSKEFTTLAAGETSPVATGCGPWPATCTATSAGPASARSGCASPAGSRWR